MDEKLQAIFDNVGTEIVATRNDEVARNTDGFLEMMVSGQCPGKDEASETRLIGSPRNPARTEECQMTDVIVSATKEEIEREIRTLSESVKREAPIFADAVRNITDKEALFAMSLGQAVLAGIDDDESVDGMTESAFRSIGTSIVELATLGVSLIIACGDKLHPMLREQIHTDLKRVLDVFGLDPEKGGVREPPPIDDQKQLAMLISGQTVGIHATVLLRAKKKAEQEIMDTKPKGETLH